MNEQLYADAIITWLAAIGVWFYISFILRHRTSSTLESSILFLLFCIFTILLERGFYWLLHYKWLGNLEFFSAALLPLAIVIFAEGLIRRHFPLPVKLLALLAALFFEFANVFGELQSNRYFLIALMIVEITIIIIAGIEVIKADKSTLTKNEIRFNNALIVAAIFAAPLLVTDFREELPWIPCRLGSDGALIFVYTCIRMSYLEDTQKIVFAEIITIFGRAFLMAISFIAISGHFRWVNLIQYFPLSLTFVLLFSILYRLKAIRVEERGSSFLRWLVSAKLSNLESYLSSLQNLSLTQEHKILREKELDGYDVGMIFDQYGNSETALHLSQLKSRVKKITSASNQNATEQLIDILERNQMNYVCLVNGSPPFMLLVTIPLVVGTQQEEMKIKVILNICRMLQKHSS